MEVNNVHYIFSNMTLRYVFFCVCIGVPFSTLYCWCRQQFLASTDLALRSQLVEFVDHELIKWKRDADVLYVSVDVDVLVQFYKQNNEDDE